MYVHACNTRFLAVCGIIERPLSVYSTLLTFLLFLFLDAYLLTYTYLHGCMHVIKGTNWSKVQGWSSVVAQAPISIPIGCGAGQ